VDQKSEEELTTKAQRTPRKQKTNKEGRNTGKHKRCDSFVSLVFLLSL
jgi:hypothetical protein